MEDLNEVRALTLEWAADTIQQMGTLAVRFDARAALDQAAEVLRFRAKCLRHDTRQRVSEGGI